MVRPLHKGRGAGAAAGVEAFTQTCPSGAPDGGPYAASSWASIAPGEIRVEEQGSQAIAPDSHTGGAFNPVPSGRACASTPDDDTPGAAVYEMEAAPAGGYTLMEAVP